MAGFKVYRLIEENICQMEQLTERGKDIVQEALWAKQHLTKKIKQQPK